MAIASVTGLTSFSNVSAAQTERSARMFKEMDADQDGKVSKEEFTKFGEKMRAQGPKGPPPGVDGSQGVSSATPAPPSPEELFSKADSNGDSSLSIDELSSMLAEAETRRSAPGAGGPQGAGGPPPGGGAPGGAAPSGSGDSSDSSEASSVAAADLNKDGVVSASEQLIYDLAHGTTTTEA